MSGGLGWSSHTVNSFAKKKGNYWKDLFLYDDIILTVGSGGSAAGIAIANYLTGSKLKWDFYLK